MKTFKAGISISQPKTTVIPIIKAVKAVIKEIIFRQKAMFL